MKIRIATRAYPKIDHEGPIESLDDVATGVKMPWIELDGTKYTDFSGFSVGIDGRSSLTTSVTLDLLGTVELVYLDGDGNEIGSVEVSPQVLPSSANCDTAFDVPEPVHPAIVQDSKDRGEFVRDGMGYIKRWPKDDES